jgi:cell wall-associated NlpC family hydrolase
LTGPRKRTLLPAALLSAVVLVGGTAISSRAAPKTATKKSSTTVKKEVKNASSTQSVIAVRRRATSARSLTSRKAVNAADPSGAENEPREAAYTGMEPPRAAETPRAAGETKEEITSSSGMQPSTSDAAVLEALARRKAWSAPRRSTLDPVKVKDPAGAREEGQREPASAVDQPAMLLAAADMAGAKSAGEASPNEDLIREALRNRGQPYVWGGASRGGFDCSGFMCYLFARQRGIKLPHSASAQARLGTPVSSSELEPGDLVFFSTYRRGISHVGMYIGDGKFIHAANSRRDVRIDSLKSGYYAKRLKAARRISSKPIRLSPDELDVLTRDPSVLPMGGSR